MTIVIDVCWIDKIKDWGQIHGEKAKQGIIIFILLASLPTFIVGFLMYADIIPSSFEGIPSMIPFDYTITLGSLAYGLIGSLILFAVTASYLKEMNTKKNWFEIKHCDKNQDCNDKITCKKCGSDNIKTEDWGEDGKNYIQDICQDCGEML